MANISGGGSGTNVSGLSFENDVYNFLVNELNHNGYRVIEARSDLKDISKTERFDRIYKDNSLVGVIGTQNTIFKYLGKLEFAKTFTSKIIPGKLKDVWSKDLVPDIILLNLDGSKNKVNIFEIKYQKDSGSVDEKLQTAIFKKEMWKKLFKQILDDGEIINYEYILSSYFKKKAKQGKTKFEFHYEDVFNFLKSHSIKYFINQSKDFDEHASEKKSTGKPKMIYKANDITLKGFNIKKYFS